MPGAAHSRAEPWEEEQPCCAGCPARGMHPNAPTLPQEGAALIGTSFAATGVAKIGLCEERLIQISLLMRFI